MTLSLDDVRNKRFRMARKSGYEVLEVDEFVDEIEESFAQLIEENQNLKKQVESLRATADDTRPMPTAASRPMAPQPSAGPPSAGQPSAAQPGAAQPGGAQPSAAPAAAAAQSAGTPPQTMVVTTAKEASSAVVRLVELTTEQAERLLAEANQEATRIRLEANQTAEQVTAQARTRAQQLEAEARGQAERLQAQTMTRSEQLGQEIDKRRADMLGQLQSQREELSSSIRELRAFEAAFRSNLTEHLRAQLNTVQTGRAEPSPVPQLAQPTAPGEGKPASAGTDGAAPPTDTPRLDALLGDQRP